MPSSYISKLKSRPLNSVWRGMVSRCYYPKDDHYHLYGARGIVVCDRWRSYRAFERDMGPRPTGHQLDRIDPNGPYSPENCRWATPTDQQRNRRNNRYLELNGERMCLSAWADRIGIRTDSLAERLKTWPLEKALTTPPQRDLPRVPKPVKIPRGPSIRQLAEERGISVHTVYVRMYTLGWDRDKALNAPAGATQQPDPNSFQGRCREAGVHPSTVYVRMRRHGITFEEAIAWKRYAHRR